MSDFESSRGITVGRTALGDIRMSDSSTLVFEQKYAEAIAEFLEHEAAEKAAREARPWEFAENGTVDGWLSLASRRITRWGFWG